MTSSYKYITIAILAICGMLNATAQHNIYITHPTSPEFVSIVPYVDSISYIDRMAILHTATGDKAFNISDIKFMSWKEIDNLADMIIPKYYRSDFDFDIAFSAADSLLAANSEIQQESDTTYTKDFVENTNWKRHISILYGGDSAIVKGDTANVNIQIKGNHILVNSSNKDIEYTLSGNSEDGSFKIYGTNKAKIVLNNLTLTNPHGPVINNQSKKRIFIVLNEGSHNILNDGTKYDKVSGEDQRGCIFSEGQICLSGNGSLTVNSKHKNGIASDDYIHIISGFTRINTKADKGCAIKVKDNFIMGGGALQMNSIGAASKALSSDSLINIFGGKLTIITTGDALWDEEEMDYSSSCCIKSKYTMNLLGGEIHALATGKGGKGINAGKEKVHGHDLNIDNALIYVRTSGSRMQDDRGNSSPKGLKAAYDVNIKSGKIYIRCTGGDGGEGIESKHHTTIDGGIIRSYCVDDGINGTGGTINGGDIFVCSTTNDGYDMNGSFTMTGGKLYIIGPNPKQAGIDNDGKTFKIHGGQIISVARKNSSPWETGRQAAICCYLQKHVNYMSLIDSEGNDIITVKVPPVCNPIGTLFSDERIKVGNSYKIVSFNELDDGTEEQGLIINPKYHDQVIEYEFTVESTKTVLGSKK